MADFKTALIALTRGDLDYNVVADNIGRILNKQPALAVDVMEQLQDAYTAGIIGPELFAQFKTHVMQLSLRENPEISIADEARAALANTGDFDLNLDLDLSPATENPAKNITRATDKDKAHTDTSWPGENVPAAHLQAQTKTQEKIGPGSVVKGRFQLDNILGVGGMGTVFRGRDLIKVEARDKNPYVALKILNEDFKDHPDAFIALQREASRQQKLAHPNIATVHDFDRTEDGTFFLTMELLEGEPLNKFIKHTVKPQGGLPFDEAFPMIEGLAKALIYAHERDIAHSDFKPGNCFITKDGTMKVLDFGIARAVKTPGQSDTEKTIFDPGKLGALTPPYASVEMLEEQEPDTRDDIYALACVAYELLTGKHPFNKLRATAARDNNLVPLPVKNLKKSQIKALNHGLGFTRADRSQSVNEFIDQLRGKTSAFGNPWITVPSIAVIFAAVGIFPLIGVMQEREMNRLIEALNSEESTKIEKTLSVINAANFDPEMRDRVLVASRTQVLNYYDERISQKVNVSENKLDFRAARALINELSRLEVFSDSAQVAIWKEAVEKAYSDVLNEQSARFNDALTFDRLLDLDDQLDVHDVLDTVASLDPELTHTFSVRLPGAYAAAIERALVNQEYERAVSLSQAGLKLVPGDPYLSNLAEKVAGEQEKAQLRSALHSAAASISDILAVSNRLTDFNDVQKDVQLIAFFEPENPILEKLKNTVTAFARQELDGLKSGPGNVSQGANADPHKQYVPEKIYDYGLLYRSLGLNPLYREHKEQLLVLENALDVNFENLRAAILDPTANIRSPKISQLLDKLSQLPSAHPRQRDALEMTARWALTMARRARSLGNLDNALSDLDYLSELVGKRISMPFVSDEKQIIIALKNNNAVHYVQNSSEQKSQFQQLLTELQNHLEAAPTGAGQISPLLDAYDALAATDPASPKLARLRAALGERALATHAALQAGGENSNATRILRRALVYFPDNGELHARTASKERTANDSALSTNAEFDDLKDELLILLNEPQANRAWSQRIQQLLLRIGEQTGPTEDWVLDTKAKASQALISLAKLAQQSERFAEASNLLWRAGHYGRSQALQNATLDLEKANRQFVLEQRLMERDARVAALKRDFKMQIRVDDIAAAGYSFKTLQRETSPDDEFVRETAPELLADAYLRVAEAAAKRDDYAAALATVKAGADVLPANNSLRLTIKDFSVGGNSQELVRVFTGGRSFDIAAQLERIREVKQLDPAYYGEHETVWAVAIAERIQQLKNNTDPTVDSQIESAKSIFLGVAIIQNLAPAGSQGKYELPITRKIKVAQHERRLSLSRGLLQALSPKQRKHQEILPLLALQDTLTDQAGEYFDRYKSSVDNGEDVLARENLAQALEIWRDNNTFIEHDARLRMGRNKPAESDSFATGTVGVKCMHRLAGQGKRFAGTCYDMLRAMTRGPLLVVIPSTMNDGGAFAIGKYEVTVGDFNTYCKDTMHCEVNAGENINLPVSNIGHHQVASYIEWLNQKTNAHYRLPTTEEWKYAAYADGGQPRKGVNCRVVQGDEVIMGQDALPIDSGKANDWGMYNYIGNIQEFAWKNGSLMAVGGSYLDRFDDCNVDSIVEHSGSPDSQTGFRVLRELP